MGMALEGGEVNAGNEVTFTGRSLLGKSSLGCHPQAATAARRLRSPPVATSRNNPGDPFHFRGTQLGRALFECHTPRSLAVRAPPKNTSCAHRAAQTDAARAPTWGPEVKSAHASRFESSHAF